MKTENVWIVTDGKEDSRNKGYCRVLNDSLWSSENEAKKWIASMKKYQPYWTDYDKLKFLKAKVTVPRGDEGGPLGSWWYNINTERLVFARSQWQGD